MSKHRTIVCLPRFIASLVGVGVVLYVLGAFVMPTPWWMSQHVQSPASALTTVPVLRPSGQDIALTCARKAEVDTSPGVLITRSQVQAMETCAQQLMTVITTP